MRNRKLKAQPHQDLEPNIIAGGKNRAKNEDLDRRLRR
jgi:hypothetical protein